MLKQKIESKEVDFNKNEKISLEMKHIKSFIPPLSDEISKKPNQRFEEAKKAIQKYKY